ncbi:MAG: hypothetical protein ACR2QO_21115 [Acidimicrobiales bacterium]
MRYLTIDGHGDPNTAAEYSTAIETLYPLGYELKFASKQELGRDYVVPPLEGLWLADDMDSFTKARDKSQWDWTLMLMVPDWIGHDLYAIALERTEAERLDEVQFRAGWHRRSAARFFASPFALDQRVRLRSAGRRQPTFPAFALLSALLSAPLSASVAGSSPPWQLDRHHRRLERAIDTQPAGQALPEGLNRSSDRSVPGGHGSTLVATARQRPSWLPEHADGRYCLPILTRPPSKVGTDRTKSSCW